MRERTGIFLLVLHSYRLRSTTGPLSWKSAEENESNAFAVSSSSVIMSRHSHPPGIAGPGVRAVGELSQHAEHARSMQPALSFSTVMNKQKLDQ